MSASENNPTATELLRHAQWVRSMARALVQDDATAEDVVQETWVAALTHAPSEGKLRPWLRQVVRNFARQHHRSSDRRRNREATAAGPDHLPGPEELTDRLETEQRLTRELARLDEPFRSTLMHRYYDNLQPAEIASRLGVPGGTVRWRLKRGLEILRARLDDAHDGDRTAWSLALLPLARIESAAAVGAGVSSIAVPGLILMNVLKVVGAAAAVCVIAVGLAVTGVLPETLVPWSLADAPVAVSFRPIEESVEPVAEAPLLEPERPVERIEAVAEVAPEPEPEAAVAAPELMVFDAHILGDGIPLAGAEMVITVLGTHREEPVRSARDGTVVATSNAWSDPVPVTVEFHATGFASAKLETLGEAGVTKHLGRIDLEPGGAVSGQILDEHGRGLAGCTVALAEAGAPTRQLEQMRFQVTEATVPSTRTDELGRFRLHGVPTGMVRLWAHADEYLSGYTAPVEVRASQESLGVELELEPLGPANLVRGIVVDPEGTPIPEADLRYRHSSRSSHTTYSGSQKADADGRFEFLLSADSVLSLTASDPEDHWGPASVAELGTGELNLVLQLVEQQTFELVVHSTEGEPVPRYAVEIYGAGGEHRLSDHPATDHPAGRAELPLPTTGFVVQITAPGHALLELGPLDPDTTGPTQQAFLAPLPGLRGVLLKDGEPVGAGIRVELREDLAAGSMLHKNGFRMRMQHGAVDHVRTDTEGRFLLTPRARGSYYVRAVPESGVPAEYGPFEVAGDLSSPDLELHLGAGGSIEGRVVFAGGVSPEGSIVGLTRGDGSDRTQRVGADGAYRFEDLMAGPWRVELRDEELRAGHTVTSSSDNGGDQPFDEWSCTVFDGETTYFDLLEVPEEHWAFTGRLTINGQPAEGWSVALAPSGSMDIDSGLQATLGRNGEFEVQATDPGPQRLILRGSLGERAEQFLVDEINVSDGSWSHDLKVGVLNLEGLEPWDGQGIPRIVHFWQGEGDMFCISMVAPDEVGAAHLERVPAGKSRLVEPSRTVDPAEWLTIRELELEGGTELTVSLD